MCTAARTGKIGDGKLFVYEVAEAIRIRNDERGKLHSSPAASEVRDEFFSTGDASAVLAARRLRSGRPFVRNTAVPSRLPSRKDWRLSRTGGFGRQEMFQARMSTCWCWWTLSLIRSKAGPPLSRFLQNLWDSGIAREPLGSHAGECCEYQGPEGRTGHQSSRSPVFDRDRELFVQLETKLPRFFQGIGRSLHGKLCRLSRTPPSALLEYDPSSRTERERRAGWVARLSGHIGGSNQLRDAQPYRLPVAAQLPELESAVRFCLPPAATFITRPDAIRIL